MTENRIKTSMQNLWPGLLPASLSILSTSSMFVHARSCLSLYNISHLFYRAYPSCLQLLTECSPTRAHVCPRAFFYVESPKKFKKFKIKASEKMT